MSQNFSVKMDEAQIADVRRMLADTKIMPEKVMSRAINKTLTGVKTDASTEIRKILNITKKKLDPYMNIDKATAAKLMGKVTGVGKVFRAIDFVARQTKKGVSVKIYKTRDAYFFEGAFIATMKSGHKGVFSRGRSAKALVGGTYKEMVRGLPFKPYLAYGRLPMKFRLPISEEWGPQYLTIFESDPVMTPVLAKAGERIQTNLEHELDFEISKL